MNFVPVLTTPNSAIIPIRHFGTCARIFSKFVKTKEQIWLKYVFNRVELLRLKKVFGLETNGQLCHTHSFYAAKDDTQKFQDIFPQFSGWFLYPRIKTAHQILVLHLLL